MIIREGNKRKFVDDSVIKSKTGCSSEQIIKKVRELFNYTSVRVKPEYWDSYDCMNAVILREMGSGEGS